MLVLNNGAITALARRDRQTAAILIVLRREGLWPPVVPSVVLVEALTGRPGPDANSNRLIKACDVVAELTEPTARRAAELRFRAGRGSAADAIVIAVAEPGGHVLTGDPEDLRALATYARGVTVDTI